jgi:RNA-directed DNA polymerase
LELPNDRRLRLPAEISGSMGRYAANRLLAGGSMRIQFYLVKLWFGVNNVLRRLPSLIRIPLLVVLFVLVFLLGILATIPWWLYRLVRGWWFRYFPPPSTRDVSQLGGDDVDLDVVSELVEDEGQPLRENHRRLIRRDPRLLPKPKLPPNIWPRPKRKKVMQSGDANRLFAGTMRTRDRRIRDLLADDQQLRRYDLPIWRTEQDIAQALDVTVGRLRYYSIHRESERVCHYVTFAIPKRNGGRRLIMAPKQGLKAIQRSLLRQLVDRLPVSDHAHGFRQGRSIRSGAEPHVGKRAVLRMDLQDFFPSVTFGRVRGLLIALGYGYQVATTLAVLMTEAERQPVSLGGKKVYVPVGLRHCVQGAPTSPGICNSICLRLDRRLAGLARKYGCDYTRYADDLTFSGNSVEDLKTIRRLAKHICRTEGFVVHPEKTRIMRRGQRQTVTGVTVNDVVGLSRPERRQLRAALHQLRTRLSEVESSVEPPAPATLTASQIAGKLAYLHMLNPAQAAALSKSPGDAVE